MIRKLINRFLSKEKKIKPLENGSVIKGNIYKIHDSAIIDIGSNCLIEGILTTYTPQAHIKLGAKIFLGKNSIIGCANSIEIGNNVLISFDCVIQDSDTHSTNYLLRRDDTTDWMNGAIIGAGSVVTKNVEPFTVVAGNPAKFIKTI